VVNQETKGKRRKISPIPAKSYPIMS